MKVSTEWMELWERWKEMDEEEQNGEVGEDLLKWVQTEWLVWLGAQLFSQEGKGRTEVAEEVNEVNVEVMSWFGTRVKGIASTVLTEMGEEGVESFAGLVIGGVNQEDDESVIVHTMLWDLDGLRNLKELCEMLEEAIVQGVGQSEKVREWGEEKRGE